jgi:hypothetical protein
MTMNVLAILAAIAVVVGLSGALYAWFAVVLHHFHGVTAKDVLTRWDAELAELSEHDREHLRTHPPVWVLEANVALPSARPRRFHVSSTGRV